MKERLHLVVERITSKMPAMYQGVLRSVFLPLLQNLSDEEIASFCNECRVLLTFIETGDKHS